MDAPKGYILDENSGMYYLEEQGVVDNKSARIISWFDPKDGSINRVTYPLNEEPTQNAEKTPKDNHEIPSGYIPYPGTDLFYISKFVKDDKGADVQRVTYFDPASGEYNNVDYPQGGKVGEPQNPKFSSSPHTPPQEATDGGKKKISALIIAIIIIVVLGIVASGVLAIARKGKKAADAISGQNATNGKVSGDRDENIILGTDGSTIDGLKLEVVAKSEREAKFIISNIKLDKEFPAPAQYGLPENEYAYVWRINMGGYAIALHSTNSALTTPVALGDLKSHFWKIESATSVRPYDWKLETWTYNNEIIIDNVVLPENSGIDFRNFNNYSFEYKHNKDRGKGNITAKLTNMAKTTTEATTKAPTTNKETTKKTTAKKSDSGYFGTYSGGDKGKLTINQNGRYTMSINTGAGYVTASGRAFYAPNESMVYLSVDNNFNDKYGFAGDGAREISLKKSGNTLIMQYPSQLGLISSGHKFKK